MTSNSSLPVTREFIAERDLLIFQMKRDGKQQSDIAKELGITTRAVGEAVKRQLARINREALVSYPEVLRLELERLDALQDSVWPLTKTHTHVMHDGTEVVVPPDLRAVDSMLRIIGQRARLLGIDTQRIDVKVSGGTEVRHTLHGAAGGQDQKIDYRQESRNMLELMMNAGIVKEDFAKKLLTELDAEDGIIEATVVEEGDENGQGSDEPVGDAEELQEDN